MELNSGPSVPTGVVASNLNSCCYYRWHFVLLGNGSKIVFFNEHQSHLFSVYYSLLNLVQCSMQQVIMVNWEKVLTGLLVDMSVSLTGLGGMEDTGNRTLDTSYTSREAAR